MKNKPIFTTVTNIETYSIVLFPDRNNEYNAEDVISNFKRNLGRPYFLQDLKNLVRPEIKIDLQYEEKELPINSLDKPVYNSNLMKLTSPKYSFQEAFEIAKTTGKFIYRSVWGHSISFSEDKSCFLVNVAYTLSTEDEITLTPEDLIATDWKIQDEPILN